MTDIKKYFGNHIVTSPDSVVGVKSVENNKIEMRNLTNNDLTKSKKHKISPTSLKRKIKSNMEAVITKQNRRRKRSHKSKEHKQGLTQDIVDISEVLSDNLTIISDVSKSDIDDFVVGTNKRNKSSSKSGAANNTNSTTTTDVKHPVDKVLKSKDINTTSINQVVDLDDFDIKPAKSVNAFQFMMDSRNKSIGSNSPGKERVEEISPKDNLKKEVLAERKTALQAWADKKGGQKRKLNDEIYDEHIKRVLNKRTKRFKKMLTGHGSTKNIDSVDLSNEEKCMRYKKKEMNESKYRNKLQKSRLCTSDEDNERKIRELKKNNDNITNLVTDLEENRLDEEPVKNINLKKTSNKDNITSPSDENHDFLSNLSSPIKKKESLLSYFGKIDACKTNISEQKIVLFSDKDEDDDTNDKVIKVKFVQKKKKIKKKSTDNLILDEEIIESTATKSEYQNQLTSERENAIYNTPKVNKRNRASLNTEESRTTPSSTWKIQFRSTPQKKDSDEETDSLHEDVSDNDVKNSPTNIVEILENSDDSMDSDIPLKNLIRRKSERLKSQKVTSDIDPTVCSVSPLKIINIRSPQIIKCVKSPRHKDCSRKDLFISPKSSKALKSAKLAPLFLKNVKPVVDEEALRAKELFLKSGVPDEVRKMIIKQRTLEEYEYDIFPTISHVQQKVTLPETKENDAFNVWYLPNETLDFLKIRSVKNQCISPIKKSEMPIGLFTSCTKNETLNHSQDVYSSEKHDLGYKEILHDIKLNYSDFPVFKVFKQFKQKNAMKLMDDLTFTNKLFRNTNLECNDSQSYKKSTEKIKKKRKAHKNLSIDKKDKRSNDGQNGCVDKKNISNIIVLDDSVEILEPPNLLDVSKSLLWTEKYCPTNSNEFLGNSALINTLKTWLIQWRDFHMIQKNNRTNYDSDCSYHSELDFIDSNDSATQGSRVRGPGNTAVLLGPVGSGKTVAVYALANELGFTILEVNASSRRSGKAILTKLQEATQSHRVRARSDGGFFSQPLELVKNSSSQKNKKMRNSKSLSQNLILINDNDSRGFDEKNLSLILVEDVNIVFDQDEGFISALSQIVQTSKRPIIFTSSEENSPYVQKFMNHLVIRSRSVNPTIFSTWLQLLCLTNNIFVESKMLYDTINFYRGDIRKVMMQIQFWIISGGDSKNFKTKASLNFEDSSNRLLRYRRSNSLVSNLPSDDNSCSSSTEDTPLSLRKIKNDRTIPPKRSNGIYKHTSLFQNLLLQIHSSPELCSTNLDNLWYNMSDFMKPSIKTTDELKANESETLYVHNKSLKQTIQDCSLSDISKLYENITTADLIYSKINSNKDLDQTISSNAFSIQTYLINRCYDDNHKQNLSKMNPLRPDCTDRRYRQDIDNSFKIFSEVTSSQVIQNRTSTNDTLLGPSIYKRNVALDYMPVLRNISRSEKCRSEISAKRNNRFYHYLRTLNINCANKTLDFTCNSLSN